MSKFLTVLDRAGFFAFLAGFVLLAIGFLVPWSLWLAERAYQGSITAGGMLLILLSAVLAIAHSIAKSVAKKQAR